MSSSTGYLGANRRIVWDLQPGYETQEIVQPFATLVTIEQPNPLGPPTPLWRYVVPPGVTQVELPYYQTKQARQV